jgi:FkbM family methyltransferase
VLPRVHRIAGHSFLARGLAQGATAIDGGANLGAFARPLRGRFGARVVCVEPVPALAEALAATGLEVLRVALAPRPGPVRLRLYQGTCASLDAGPRPDQVGEIEVAALDLAGLLARLGDPASVALLKLDIEGPESALLLAAEPALLRRFRQITVEFHDFLDPRLAPAVAAAIDHLRAAGFHGVRFSRDNSDWLFVNARELPLSALARGYLRHPYRLARGLLRKAARRLGLGHGWAERNF